MSYNDAVPASRDHTRNCCDNFSGVAMQLLWTALHVLATLYLLYEETYKKIHFREKGLQ